jgi:uridine kinase
VLTLPEAAAEIHRRAAALHRSRALLVGLSGIDGSGKGYLAERLTTRLRLKGIEAVGINVDGWLNLPDRRFDPARPAEHFYQHALRMDDLFERLILPLKATRRADIMMDFAEETATAYRRQRYRFEDVDVVLLEGIYLYKRQYRPHFDLAIWVECSFETALTRALARGQEGLPPDQTTAAYRTIYFPAQHLHFERDDPVGGADFLLPNDPLATIRRAG